MIDSCILYIVYCYYVLLLLLLLLCTTTKMNQPSLNFKASLIVNWERSLSLVYNNPFSFYLSSSFSSLFWPFLLSLLPSYNDWHLSLSSRSFRFRMWYFFVSCSLSSTVYSPSSSSFSLFFFFALPTSTSTSILNYESILYHHLPHHFYHHPVL